MPTPEHAVRWRSFAVPVCSLPLAAPLAASLAARRSPLRTQSADGADVGRADPLPPVLGSALHRPLGSLEEDNRRSSGQVLTADLTRHVMPAAITSLLTTGRRTVCRETSMVRSEEC